LYAKGGKLGGKQHEGGNGELRTIPNNTSTSRDTQTFPDKWERKKKGCSRKVDNMKGGRAVITVTSTEVRLGEKTTKKK